MCKGDSGYSVLRLAFQFLPKLAKCSQLASQTPDRPKQNQNRGLCTARTKTHLRVVPALLN